MKRFLLYLSALFVGVSFATAQTQTYEISPSTGTLTNGNNSTRSSVWSSTELTGFTLEADYVDAMCVNSGLQLYAYNNGKVTYTINAPEGYSISAYTIKYKKGSSSYTITLSAAGVESQTPGRVSSEQTFEVAGLSGESVAFTLEGTAVRDFIKNVTIFVDLQDVGEGGEEPGDDSALMELYAAIEKPTFGKAGNTTFVKAATLTGGVEAEVVGVQAVAGQACVTNAIPVEMGAQFDLNITYQLNWGDLAIYQIENGEATKEYGYYYGSWEPNGSTAKVVQYISADGISVTEVVNGTCTATFPISINENHNPGDIVVVRAITGVKNNATNSAFEQNISEGGYVDFLFVVTEPVAESWSSFYAVFPVAIPEGIEAYIVTAVNGGYVTLTQIYNAVPANTGVILKGGRIDASTDNYYSGAVTEVAGNLLRGTMSNTYIDEEAYVLGKVDGVVGLYKALMTDGKWLNNANKAYLPVSALTQAAQGAASFSFRFGEGTTAIENVEVENEVKAIYDLTGRKVNEITVPGIYIVNGVKRVVR